jgi:hypothetical protein
MFAAELPALDWLQIDRSHVTSLAPLVDALALESLSIAGTAIGDAELENLLRLPRLRTLTLTETLVTDAGARRLAAVGTLWRLWLTNTSVTDATLSAFHAHPRLDTLDVRGSRVTRAGIEALARARPSLLVLGDDWDEMPARLRPPRRT